MKKDWVIDDTEKYLILLKKVQYICIKEKTCKA